MKIDPIDNSQPPGAAPGAAPSVKDEFLRLLVAQLEHQNPLDPQDGADFVAQLAQFANVEQGAQTTDLLGQIQAEQRAAAGASLAGFVGANATASADQLHWSPSDGPPPDLFVDLDDPASSVTVTIRDDAGNEVKTIELGPQGEGDVSIGWDGTDALGVPVGEGDYSIEVEAAGKDGGPVAGAPRLRGVVEAVEFADGLHLLRIGAVTIAPSQIRSIGD